MKNNKGFVSFLGMIFALGLVLWIAYLALNTYFGRIRLPVVSRKDGSVSVQDTNPYNMRAVETSAKETIDDITRQRVKDLETIKREINP
jgi:hypothetical protein